jgi:hypothetical protein
LSLNAVEKFQLGAGGCAIVAWLVGIGAVITFWVLVFRALLKYVGS